MRSKITLACPRFSHECSCPCEWTSPAPCPNREKGRYSGTNVGEPDVIITEDGEGPGGNAAQAGRGQRIADDDAECRLLEMPAGVLLLNSSTELSQMKINVKSGCSRWRRL
ncbi:hypothetical protein PI124_g11896 [Phytophthora idaei]|nr:hypothetical protein PI125_g13309 [Phytophthora idaei]KAG3152238.1 hypothetical protein PI126_g10616 [Phytophthora idaei]KAG3243287.1 hypothetical protein PI124_g11896 [Phytophthora idaei]